MQKKTNKKIKIKTLPSNTLEREREKADGSVKWRNESVISRVMYIQTKPVIYFRVQRTQKSENGIVRNNTI